MRVAVVNVDAFVLLMFVHTLSDSGQCHAGAWDGYQLASGRLTAFVTSEHGGREPTMGGEAGLPLFGEDRVHVTTSRPLGTCQGPSPKLDSAILPLCHSASWPPSAMSRRLLWVLFAQYAIYR